MILKSTFKTKRLIILVFFCTLLSFTSRAQIVAGFFGDWHTQAELNQVQFNKLTDVFYAFIYSDYNGNVYPTTPSGINNILTPMVTKAHAAGARAHVSLGGANNSSSLSSVIGNAGTRSTLVNSIKNFIQTHNLDGFNMDWEFPSAGDANNLAQFMVDMRAAMNNLESVMGKKLYLSAAVGPLLWNTDGINSSFINQCDYIYVMAFDAQGNCCVCETNHSGMNVAKWSIEKWTNIGLPWANCGGSTAAKNAPNSKIVLAIPFYSNSHQAYKDFSASDPSGFYNDADGFYNGQYYNSRPMIEQKINMIMNTYGGAGVWCWELPNDRNDQYSLLNAMWNGMQPYFCQGPGAAGTITGNNTVCAGATGVTYSIPAVTGATSYEWTVPSGATITSGANTRTITVKFGSSGGNVTVTPKNSCGNGTSSSMAVTINDVPPTPGAITGPTSVCPNQTGVNYSINPVAGATGYAWTLPSGATITSGNNTTSITVSFGGSTGTISVRATNGCGNSTSSSTLNVSSSSGASNAGAITGSGTVCANSTGNVYSIAPVSGAAGYNWTVPAGATITSGSNTNSITVTFGTTGGTISVTPTSSCGNGNPSSRTVTVNSAPGAAGTITGTASVCANGTATYSISPVSGATGYTWTVPSGATITSGNNTTSINVSFGSTSGNVTVTPTNGTCSGASASRAVTVNTVPANPGTITGNASVCPNTAGVAYSVGAVSGATSYVWSYSGNNATINGAGNNITINFAANATSGNLTVAAVNSCGTSSTSSKALTVGTGLSVTGASRCGSGPVNLTINTPGGPYLWYTSASGGSSIHTGATYSPNVTTTTTYYVEQSSVTSGQVGMTSAPPTDEQVYDPYSASRVFPTSANTMNFSTSQPNVTINSVDIYTGAGSQAYLNNFWITIENSAGNVLFTSAKYSIPASYPTPNPKFKTVTINHLLPTAGNYSMRIYCDPQADAWGQVAKGQTMPVSDASNTVTLLGGYNCFTNLKFQYGSSGSACGRTPIVATVNSPATTGLTVTANSPICSGTNGQVTVQGSQSGVSYQPYIGGNAAGTAVTGTGGNINLTVNSANLSAGNNTITVKATSEGCGTVDLTSKPVIQVNPGGAPTITFNNITKTYGDASFTLNATSNSAGAMTYSLVSSTPDNIVTVASNGQVTILGAGTATVKVDQAASGCYTAGSATAVITINKANRTVTITSANSGNVGATINLTHTVSAGTGAASWSVTNGTGTASLSGTSLSLTGEGTVTVTVTVAADANYNSATANQTITIGAAPAPTITFNNITKTYGDASFTLNATSNSAGAMTYSLVSSTPDNIVTVASNGQVTILGAGTATVKVDQAASGAYGAGSATAVITIEKADRTVNITSANHGFTNNTIALAYSVSAGGGTASWSVTNGSGTASLSGSTLSLITAGTVTISVTVAADANYNSATANQTITIYQGQTQQPGEFTESTNTVYQGDVGVVYTVPYVD
ncbi:MAG TPA: glycosyl hydrolase family 18 protein, partial [Cytophagaceae bacterium]